MRLTFVGRQRELALLEESFQTAVVERNNGCVVVVRGEPGVGKSRLVREFARTISNSIVINGAATPASSPFQAWRNALAAFARRTGIQVDSVFAGHGAEDMADIADRVLSVLSEAGLPVVLILEDIHWMDSASLRLLQHIVPMVSNEALLIIATLRTDFNGRSSVDLPTSVTMIALGGLTQSDLAVGLATVYPDADPGEVTRAANRLVELTGGNPLAAMGIILQLERSGSDHLIRRLTEVRGLSPLRPSDADPLDTAVEAVLAGLSENERHLLGIAALIESLDLNTVARYAKTDPGDVSYVFEQAAKLGVVDLSVNPPWFAHALLAAGLRDRVPNDQAIEVHADRCRELAAASDPTYWHKALEHGQNSQGLVSPSEIAELADRAAAVASDEFAYEDAIELYGIATEYASQDEPGSVRARRLLAMATAHERLGSMTQAWDLFRSAARIAAQTGNRELQAQAAIGFAMPTDWRAGNLEALQLIGQAQNAGAPQADSIQLSALQAVLEMRIPQKSELGSQWSWVLRPRIAQPRAEKALQAAQELDDPRTLLIAQAAWRTTHRGPSHLARRLAISHRTLDLAVELKHNDYIAEGVVRLTVDAIESGNRPLADEAVATLRWAADRTRDQRLNWRALILEGFMASLVGDWEGYDRCRAQALEIGQAAEAPGALPVFITQGAYRCLAVKDKELLEESRQVMNLVSHHPLGAAAIGYGFAILGEDDLAKQYLESSLLQQDDESSVLVCLAWCAQGATLLGDPELSARILELITPWRDRVAVDADATTYAGPLEPIVAALEANGSAPDIDRSLQVVKPSLLTPRETLVLEAISRGLTNSEIAEELHFSLATVRRDTMSIYAKLQVRGRSEAVKRALQLGLLVS